MEKMRYQGTDDGGTGDRQDRQLVSIGSSKWRSARPLFFFVLKQKKILDGQPPNENCERVPVGDVLDGIQ